MEYEFCYDVKTDCFQNEFGAFVSIVCPHGTEYLAYHLKKDFKEYYEKYNYDAFVFNLQGEYIKDRFHNVTDLRSAFEYATVPMLGMQEMIDDMVDEQENNEGVKPS